MASRDTPHSPTCDMDSHLRALRCSASADDYLDYCRKLCATASVSSNKIRAAVWRDVLLGLQAPPAVPLLSDIFVQRPPTTPLVPTHSTTISGGGAAAAGGRRSFGTSSDYCAYSDGEESALSSSISTSVAASAGPSSLRRRTRSVPSNRRTPTDATAGDGGGRAAGATAAAATATVSYGLPANCQPRVVQADIERSLWTLYPESGERERMRRKLKDILLRLLAANGSRYYYQGLHELMGFVMYILLPHEADDVVLGACQALLRVQWKPFSDKSLRSSQAMLYAMHAILAKEDPPFAATLEGNGVGPESHYAVSWVITWFAHNVRRTDVLAAIFDYCIAFNDAYSIIFFTAALLMSHRPTIMKWTSPGNGALQDEDPLVVMAYVYRELTKMPTAVLEAMSEKELHALMAVATTYRGKYMDLVRREEQNFLDGHVCKLGMLANAQTRNAVLPFVRRFLPREWRRPVASMDVRKTLALLAPLVVVAAVSLVTVLKGGADAPAPGGWW